jgi:hypothetical protein
MFVLPKTKEKETSSLDATSKEFLSRVVVKLNRETIIE